MKVRLIDERPPAGELELARLQDAMGAEAPSDYIAFVSKRNGCQVETNLFRVDDGCDCGVNAFLDVDRVIREKVALGDRLSRHAWPIADAEGGNYVCLRLENAGSWSVVFWDHELERETVVSSTFAGNSSRVRCSAPGSIRAC